MNSALFTVNGKRIESKLPCSPEGFLVAQRLLPRSLAAATPRKLVNCLTRLWLVFTFTLGCHGLAAELKTDIEYGKAGDVSLQLDASVPDGRGPFPVVVIVHGGGWSSGDKQKDITPLFDPLTQSSFAWFSINYRLAPTNRWPAGLEDVQTAIRWVKAHAAEFKGDTNRIALIGYSSGGQLICQAVVLAKDDTRVQAVVALAAPTDLVADTDRRGGLSISLTNLLGRVAVDDEVRATLHDISPINHVKPGLPPFLLIQGDADKSVPIAQSLNFQAKLKENGVRCELVIIKGAPHQFTEWEKFDATYTKQMAEWLQRAFGVEKSSESAGTK